MPDAEIELRAPAPTVPTTFSVQVPPDGVAGATMRVTAPNGVMLDITVPHGAAPGSSFEVTMPAAPTTFLVQMPPDGVPGATMRVTAPNGVMLDVTVPHGATPGGLFEVAMPAV